MRGIELMIPVATAAISVTSTPTRIAALDNLDGRDLYLLSFKGDHAADLTLGNADASASEVVGVSSSGVYGAFQVLSGLTHLSTATTATATVTVYRVTGGAL